MDKHTLSWMLVNVLRFSFSVAFYVIIVFAIPEIARHSSSIDAIILYVFGISILVFLYVNARLSLRNLC
jgi:hypothetical protein